MSEQVAPPPAPDAAAQPPSAVPAPPPAEPTKKSGSKKALGIVGAVVAFLVVAGLKFGVGSAIGNFLNKDETADAKVGDCIAELPEVTGTKEEKVDGAKVVQCTSTDAVYNVVGRVDGQTEAQARTGEACEQYIKEDQDGYVFYSIEPGKKGYLLCLTKKA
ncbi:LppU/SCO3897 family protein [Micromonospora sp. NPDC004336]